MSAAAWPCVRESAGSVLLDVLVAPNAKRTQCMGLHDGALRIRLAAQPVEGRANDALLRWVAAELGVARGQVSLWRGDSTKRKQLRIELPLAPVVAWLDQALA